MNSILQGIVFCFSLLFLTVGVNAQDCGVKRWDVKTLSDTDTLSIDFKNIRKSSVHKQVAIPKPHNQTSSRLISEDTVYSITCYIIAFKKESDDKDIHIVIKDKNTNETMVAEIISSECYNVQQTSRYLQMQNLNEWFALNIGYPKKKFTYLRMPVLVTLTGVGFFDALHGQKGVAMNGREIHPVLTMKIKEPLKKIDNE